MTSGKYHLPFNVNAAANLILVAIIFALLYVGQHILIPIFLSLLFAILLRPLVVFFNIRWHIPNVLASLMAILISIILLAGIFIFISWQIAEIADRWNQIQNNFILHFQHLQKWLKIQFSVSYIDQNNFISNIVTDLKQSKNAILGGTLSSFSGVIVNGLLIPIYTFLLLLYRAHFSRFLFKLVHPTHAPNLREILAKIKTIIHSYLIGLFVEMGIVAALTTGGLMILGVEFALLLGIITAILNLIPYLGILMATLISVFATLSGSGEIYLILAVVLLSGLVQIIDNNILVPKILGNKVRINAMASIFGVVVGGAIAGIAGMFLAIPILAIVKVIFDKIKPLEPWGFLIGDDTNLSSVPIIDLSKISKMYKKKG